LPPPAVGPTLRIHGSYEHGGSHRDPDERAPTRQSLDQHTTAELVGVKPAAAYELLRTLKAHVGESIVEEVKDGRATFRFGGELVAPPKFLSVVATCVGTRVSRVVGGARLQHHMRDGLDYLLERVRRKDGSRAAATGASGGPGRSSRTGRSA
jgi:hypothetical protein